MAKIYGKTNKTVMKLKRIDGITFLLSLIFITGRGAPHEKVYKAETIDMKFKKLLLLAIGCFIAQFIIAQPAEKDLPSHLFKVDRSYLTKHDIVFLSPTQLEAEGFPMGNGNMGGMVWNHNNGMEIQINKNDLWSKPDPAEFNTSILKHAARLKIDFGSPVFSWIHLERFEGRLSLKNGEVNYKANTAYSKTTINTWLSSSDNVWVIDCENVPNTKYMKDGITSTISLERIGSRAFSGWYGGGFPKSVAVGIGDANTKIEGKDIILEENGIGVNFVVACRIIDADSRAEKVSSRSVELKSKSNSFKVLVSVVTEKENDDPEAAAIALLDKAEATTVDALRKGKNAWYEAFWEKSFVKLGDNYLENIYYLRRYLMAASSRGEYPCSFNGGLWRWNRDVLNWVTPHHWNTQQQYWGLCAQNDTDLMLPYLNTYFNMIPYGEALAKEKGAKSDAILITEAHDFDGYQVSKNRSDMKNNFIPAIQIAALFWDYYAYTGDLQFLREKSYVFMKKALNFYLDKLEWDKEKKEYFLLASVHESAEVPYVKNPITDRNSLEALLKNCIKAAKLLHTDKNESKKWKYVLDHLWDRKFIVDGKMGKVIAPADEYFTEKRYSPMEWAAAGSIAFPAGVIGIDEKHSEYGEAVSNFVKHQTILNAHYPIPIVAARMGMGEEALNYLLKGVEIHQMYPQGLMHNLTGYPDNIYDLNSIHDLLGGRHLIRSQDFFHCGMEPISNYATAMNEMLLQSNEGKIRVFPAIPTAWFSEPLAFKLLARGAFVVSAEKDESNSIKPIMIQSLKGNVCYIQNPWPGEKITISEIIGNKKIPTSYKLKNRVIIFNTKTDSYYLINRADNMPLEKSNTYSAKPNQKPKKLGKRILGKKSGWDAGYRD